MNTTVTRIEKYEPVKASDLPNGEYAGVWGGYEITVRICGLSYRLHTIDGIRTPYAACTVVIKDGAATARIGRAI